MRLTVRHCPREDSFKQKNKAGVTTLLIRGFEPVEDAIAYGRDVIPLVRQEVQRQERQTATAV